MRQLNFLKVAVLLIGLFSFPDVTISNSWVPFPNSEAFQGIKRVLVARLTFKNMESVKLTPEKVQASMQDQLRNAEISVFKQKFSQQSPHSDEQLLEDVGVLTATIRRWESSGPLGTTMNSFTITLRFFQKATVQSSQRKFWVITWEETKSVLSGINRPKGITKALEELVQDFIKNYKV